MFLRSLLQGVSPQRTPALLSNNSIVLFAGNVKSPLVSLCMISKYTLFYIQWGHKTTFFYAILLKSSKKTSRKSKKVVILQCHHPTCHLGRGIHSVLPQERISLAEASITMMHQDCKSVTHALSVDRLNLGNSKREVMGKVVKWLLRVCYIHIPECAAKA